MGAIGIVLRLRKVRPRAAKQCASTGWPEIARWEIIALSHIPDPREKGKESRKGGKAKESLRTGVANPGPPPTSRSDQGGAMVL